MWTASAFHDETFCIIYNDKWAMGLHINETLDNIFQWILSQNVAQFDDVKFESASLLGQM